MSKKDYQAIASAIYRATAPQCPACSRGFTLLSGGTYGCAIHGIREPQWPEAAEMRGEVVRQLAQVMAADNPRFNRERFTKACLGPECGGCGCVGGHADNCKTE